MNSNLSLAKIVLTSFVLCVPLLAQAEGGVGSTSAAGPGSRIDRGCNPPGAACPFDLNCDGKVNDSDVTILMKAWGKPGMADFNADSVVDGSDLGMQLGAWGLCPKIDPKARRAALYRQCTKKFGSIRHDRKKITSTLKTPACKAYRK